MQELLNKILESISGYYKRTEITESAIKEIYSKEDTDEKPQIEHKYYERLDHIKLKKQSINSNNVSSILSILLCRRRSLVKYKEGKISQNALNYILTNSLGVSDSKNQLRTYHSAGPLFPVDAYLILLKQAGTIKQGIYHYCTALNCLELIDNEADEDIIGKELFGKEMPKNTAFYLFFVSCAEKQVDKYGEKALSLSYVEAGHMAQNVAITAITQKMGSCFLETFIEQNVIKKLRIRDPYEYPIYAISVGLDPKKINF